MGGGTGLQTHYVGMTALAPFNKKGAGKVGFWAGKGMVRERGGGGKVFITVQKTYFFLKVH